MSTKVVTAPAGHAKRSVRSDKPAKQAAQQPAVAEDEARLANDDSEQEVSVAPVNAEETAPVESETSMAGDFTFGSALAEAAAASGSLISDAQRADEVGFGALGDGDGSTPLLLAAIGLAAVGLIFLVKDGGGGDDEVVPVNRAPTITAPAAATTAEDTALTINAPTTADPDAGDTVTVTATATNGTIVKNANGSFTFTPTANFNGTAVITYSATDGKVTTPVTATQNVTVTAVNDAPTITVPTVAAINEDSTGVTFTVVTADPDAGSTVTTTATVPAAQGTVTKNADGTFTFVPAANFNGTAVITLSSTDGVVTTPTTATLNITVNAVNDPATLTPLTVTTPEDTALNLSDAITVTDIDGDAALVTAAISTQPQKGTISIVNGDVIYTPSADYNGPDSVGITLTDAGGATSTFTVAINVTPVDDGPVVTNSSIDVGTANVAANRDAGTASFNFTDNAEATTNVNITNFTNNDKITVTNAVSSDYNFGRSFEDINDLVITYTDADTGATNRIVIQDILPDAGAATSLAAVNTLLGFTFMTFA
jgi:VCBS repeat-containing protein